MLEIGSRAPEFTLESDLKKNVSLSDFKGKKIILYFYPKDNTPGCSIEAKNFNDYIDTMTKNGIIVLGVSKDTIKSHCNFKEKLGLNFLLLSDPDHEVMEVYDAWGDKKLYGKTYKGTIRSTILIDENGIVEKIWPKVKAKTHITEVLDYLGIGG